MLCAVVVVVWCCGVRVLLLVQTAGSHRCLQTSGGTTSSPGNKTGRLRLCWLDDGSMMVRHPAGFGGTLYCDRPAVCGDPTAESVQLCESFVQSMLALELLLMVGAACCALLACGVWGVGDVVCAGLPRRQTEPPGPAG